MSHYVLCLGLLWGARWTGAQVPLTEEDLIEARARGELSAEEYEELLDLFERRQEVPLPTAAGDTLASAAPIADDLARLLTRAEPAGAEDHSRFDYQVSLPLRGEGSRRQWLRLRPCRGGLDLDWELARSEEIPWRVRRGSATYAAGPFTLTAGAFEQRLTGGLQSGPSPAFLDRHTTLRQTLLYPERGRLNGARLVWHSARMQLVALLSLRHAGALRHRAAGVQLGRQAGRFRIEAGLLRQELAASDHPGEFALRTCGLSVIRTARDLSGRFDVATGRERWAAQGRLRIRPASDLRVDVAAWCIDPGFRHPLLGADTEPDRESIRYPEIGRALPTTATGERGGETALRITTPARRAELALALWREQPLRPASARCLLAWARNSKTGYGRLEYAFRSRPAAAGRESRHQWTASWRLCGGFGLVQVRSAPNGWGTSGRTGGRVEGGYRLGTPAADRGALQLRVAWEDLDVGKERSAFFTVRVDHELQVGPGRRIAVYMRWRSAYHGEPAALSLRLRSGWET